MTRKSRDSRVNREPFKTLKKKKKLQEPSAYRVLLRMKRVTYIGSTVIPTSSSLEMIQVLWAFFPEKPDQFVEVSAEINGSLKFGILGLF